MLYEARAMQPSQSLNMNTLQDNANTFLPALKQTPLIHAASFHYCQIIGIQPKSYTK
jgi:hypothetical protein